MVFTLLARACHGVRRADGASVGEPVKLEMLDAPVPQYLHSYRGLSAPSYKACLPLFALSGWREQGEPVRLKMLEDLVPQGQA
jgi:hypothetical protein